MNVRFSRALAIIFGIALPVLGVVRNWTTPNGDAAGLFIDLAAGSLLLYGVWRVAENEHSGQRFLAAGWGMAVGLSYASMTRHIEEMSVASSVAAPILPEWSLATVAVALLVSIVGLVSSLRSIRRH